MSVSTFVILQGEKLPTLAEWQRALDEAGFEIVLDATIDLRSHVGYLPAKFKDMDSGFEWHFGEISEVFGRKLEVAGSRSQAIEFATHSDEQEAICALLSAGTLARISDGLVYDEESENFVPGEHLIKVATDWAASEERRKESIAAADANLTDRRCPECGARCPTYRKSCKACGFAIGRA